MRREVHRQQATTRQARATTSGSPGPLVEVEQRELGSYDRLFTVIDGGADKEAG
jgi:hypothetical protein